MKIEDVSDFWDIMFYCLQCKTGTISETSDKKIFCPNCGSCLKDIKT